ncbi:hypothetical protein [Novosphingobium sp.]|uniref:hypothetical protein n=1 Tax=Novosphingobium sp. TaxID=1874826 RepID=UPI003342AAD8
MASKPERKCKGNCNHATGNLTSVLTCMAVNEGLAIDQFRHPYWGKARSANMIGAGFMIGFKNAAGDGWRLDFDTNPAAESKFFHVNYEGADGTKVYHYLKLVDAQPFKFLDLPPGFKKITTPLEQMKRLWFTWTKYAIGMGTAKLDAQVMLNMAAAYKDFGINTADQFIDRIKGANTYEDIAFLLTNAKS